MRLETVEALDAELVRVEVLLPRAKRRQPLIRELRVYAHDALLGLRLLLLGAADGGREALLRVLGALPRWHKLELGRLIRLGILLIL